MVSIPLLPQRSMDMRFLGQRWSIRYDFVCFLRATDDTKHDAVYSAHNKTLQRSDSNLMQRPVINRVGGNFSRLFTHIGNIFVSRNTLTKRYI